MFGWFRTKSAQSTGTRNATPAGNASVRSWSARMWYRFVTYREGGNVLSLDVDVMADGPDIVFVPSADAWERTSPPFARGRRDEVVERLKAVKWNRELVWEESDAASCSTHDPSSSVVPGSIESTPGGKFVEQQNLFGPDSPVSFAQARSVWSQVEVQYAAQASGRVTLFVSTARPNSMFKLISLPALQRNPNVTLDFK